MPQGSSPLPYVETTVASLMRSRMEITHEDCGISVVSGPWGIGKTTAIDDFARERDPVDVFVVKVEPGASKRGATQGDVLKRVNEVLRIARAMPSGTHISNSTWTLRQMIYTHLVELFGRPGKDWDLEYPPQITFIFDEAQYLSREAIEMLRFWNDRDRTTTPFPVGLIFVGNNEFAMAETLQGESVLSGAVRSRLLFEVALGYTHLSDTDLTLFAQSRGVQDAAALREFVSFFSQPRVKRDLRTADRLLGVCRREGADGPISYEIVRDILSGR